MTTFGMCICRRTVYQLWLQLKNAPNAHIYSPRKNLSLSQHTREAASL